MTPPARQVLRWDPNAEPAEDALQFRLTYQGLLLGAGNKKGRPEHKHDVRRAFHPQLRRLWRLHPALAQLGDQQTGSGKTHLEQLADLNSRFGYRFAPLVTPGMRCSCAVEILFLRPGERGGIVNSADLDNRLKTLFDALSIPADASGVPAPGEDEDPFFCLLQDDKLITHAAVETDVLLEPVSEGEDDNDARLIMTVRIDAFAETWLNPYVL